MKELVKVENTAVVAADNFGTSSVIDEFISSRHASENTNRTYRNALKQLVKYFAANNITQPAESDIDSFVNTLKAAKKSAATIRLYVTVCKSFFAFTARKGFYPDVAADVTLKLRKSNTHAKRALTDAQAKALLASVKGDNLQARRNRAIIALALVTGVRTVEISRANRGNLREDGVGGYFLAVQGKGRLTADAEVRVPPAVARLIDEYLSLRGEVEDSEPLFTSASRNVAWTKPTKKRKANSYGNRLSEQSIGKLIKRQMKSVGIDDKKITAHSCRHFAATTAIKAGVDVREVSAMLRHSSLNVTAIYLHDLSVETRRAEMSVAESLFGGAA